ncbi:MAG: hypothetical protein F6K31_28725, partial [Symploca sp. SIO2G7]|nr:hypothetical protein [Symploca sp. SIO2G7]
MTKTPSILELERKDKCPDCLLMNLKGFYKEQQGKLSFLGFQSADNKAIELHLDINFNEQWEALPVGRIKFGIRSGELRLRLENGNIPLANRELNDPFEVTLKKDRQHQEGSEDQNSIEASVAKGEPGLKAISSYKTTEGKTDKFQFTACQITTKGAEETPAWVFEVATEEPVLKIGRK